ncbi:MAG: Lrp/AsnC ligand binding domain-containing protein [Halofilum sp. (in: g-proteobacteria)]
MVTAIMLMNVERGRIHAIAEALTERPGVSEVYSVSGNYDLVATLRVATNEDLARLVTEEIASVEGIEHTETMLAFQTHSRHDLEAMFSVGQD